MRWLVDGYNVIRRDPDLRLAEAESLERARAALVRLVARAAQQSGDRFTVVFDGAPIRGRAAVPGQIEIVFSRPPQSADDVLVAEARRWREGAIVVTSDRTVQTAVRRAGGTAVPSEAFVAALDAPEIAEREDARDDDDDDAPPKQGNPRRPSREERAVRRALTRLRPRP